MSDVTLQAEKRPERGSRPAGRLRRAGLLPAVVYGLKDEAVPVTVPERDVAQILASETGANTLIMLQVDGTEQLTLAREIQRDPVRGELIHLDFVRIRRDVAVTAEVPVSLVGEAPGTREGGIVEQLLFSLSVSAKPADIPRAIVADISSMELNDHLRFEDLDLPPGVETAYEADELIAQVIVPRVVEEAVPEGEAEIEEGEEAAEPAEGEAETPAAEGEPGGGAAEGGEG